MAGRSAVSPPPASPPLRQFLIILAKGAFDVSRSAGHPYSYASEEKPFVNIPRRSVRRKGMSGKTVERNICDPLLSLTRWLGMESPPRVRVNPAVPDLSPNHIMLSV